jgi:hypothetical protein
MGSKKKVVAPRAAPPPVEEPEFLRINIADLIPTYDRDLGDNPNVMGESDFLSLKAFMKSGVLQTILVHAEPGKRGKYRIDDGHHRYWAALDEKIDTLPALASKHSSALAKLAGIGMNRLRGDIDLAAAGNVARQVLEETQWTLEQISIPTGLSVAELEALTQEASDGADDVLEDLGSTAAMGEDEGATNDKPFVLEISFTNRDDYKFARRALKKAAGKGGDLARGLLTIVGKDEDAS